MKRTKPMVIVVFLALASFILNGDTKGNNFELLMQKAYKFGNVRVILELDVPDIDRLTSRSVQFRTGDRSSLARQGGFSADLELEAGISEVADRVLYRLNQTGYRINGRYSTLPLLALSLSPEAMLQLSSMDEVISISEDVLIPLPKPEKMVIDVDIPGKPVLTQSSEIVGANKAWALGITGSGWYIAVLDTGIRPTHEMFAGKDIVEACYSGENDCPNGSSQMIGPGSAAHYFEYNYLGGFDHGTHVAGIAAGDNGKGKSGISKGSNIIAVQVFSYFASEDDIMSWSSDQLKGLEYVYSLRNTYNIASVNISIGGGEYGSFCNGGSYDNAIRNLMNVGIATVIASGNEYYCNGVAHPSCYEKAIATGASAKNDVMAGFSNWKKGMIDLFAPGVGINSAIGTIDTGYASWQGTSMAAPHVAGAWGLLKQMDWNMSVDRALQLLQQHGHMITSTCPSGGQVARIDVGESIMSLLDVAPPINFSGATKENRALLQVEYFNELTWDTNPYNASQGKNIVEYRVYLVEDSQLTLLDSFDSATFSYRHRKISKTEDHTYAVKAVTDTGKESIPAYVTVKGVTE